MKPPNSKLDHAKEKKASRNGLRLIIGGPVPHSESANSGEPKTQRVFRSQLAACLEAMADDLDEQIKTLSKF